MALGRIIRRSEKHTRPVNAYHYQAHYNFPLIGLYDPVDIYVIFFFELLNVLSYGLSKMLKERLYRYL